MKPIKIVIEGINSFTSPQTLDFETVGRANLFCISGKTGAGKTTIFDSIMLALYGGIGRGRLADIVNLSRTKARVVFDFTENGDMYTVERTVSCRPSDRNAAVTDCLLCKNGAPIAKGAGETNAVIKSIIGLEESEFKNVYMLEQGAYADFLKKTAGEQIAAVGKIFSLMRFEDVCKRARERKKTEDAEADAHGKLAEAYGNVTAESLRAEKTELAALKSKTTALKKTEEAGRAELAELKRARDLFNEARTKQENVKNLMLQADAAKAKLEDATNQLNEFEAAQDKTAGDRLKAAREKHAELISLAAADKACAEAESTAEKRKAAAAEHKQAAEKAEKKRVELAEQLQADERAFAAEIALIRERARNIPNKSQALLRLSDEIDCQADEISLAAAERDIRAERESYIELSRQIEQKAAELDKTKEDRDRWLGTIERYVAELAAMQGARDDAEKERIEAERALEAARINSHAHAVRAELHAGDVCPVCGGVYGGGMECGDTDVEKRKAEFDEAAAGFAAACERLGECERSLDRAKTEYNHAEEKRAICEGECSRLREKAADMRVDVDIHGELAETLKKAQAAARRLNSASAACEKHRAETDVVCERLAAAEKSVAEAEERAAELKRELGEYYRRTDGMLAALKAEIDGLEKIVAETEARRGRITLEAGGARAALETVEQSLARAKAECPVDLPTFDEEAYNGRTAQNEQLLARIAANEVEIARREVEVGVHEQNLAGLAKACAERDAHLKKSKLYGELVEITKGKAMLNFVAAEYIEDFTAAASDILSELSSGKYTMGYDKENGFYVSDYLNDGKLRKTDTLSGGELFLASLSVAIAIARTQAGGNNAFFFLDEGFGTLDDDLIDTVYAALESLSRDCLVGVISHSAALIEKMPSCVEVIEANDVSGSIIKY